jgi:hypothetical protein
MHGARKTVLVVSAVSSAATVVVALLPRTEIASRQPALRAGLGEVPPSVAMIAGFVVLGRLARGARLTELALTELALTELALTELALTELALTELALTTAQHGTEMEAVL